MPDQWLESLITKNAQDGYEQSRLKGVVLESINIKYVAPPPNLYGRKLD